MEVFLGERVEEKTFENKQFLGVDFRGATLVSVRFSRCLLSECLFEGARFQDVTFEDCKVVNAGFHLVTQKPFFSMVAQNTLFMGCNFAGCQLKGTSLKGSTFEMCHFLETHLENADCSETRFAESPMNQCVLKKANFIDAVGYGIDPRVNEIQKAKFSLPEAVTLLQAFDIIVE